MKRSERAALFNFAKNKNLLPYEVYPVKSDEVGAKQFNKGRIVVNLIKECWFSSDQNNARQEPSKRQKIYPARYWRT